MDLFDSIEDGQREAPAESGGATGNGRGGTTTHLERKIKALEQLKAQWAAWGRDTLAWKGIPLCQALADGADEQLKKLKAELYTLGTEERRRQNLAKRREKRPITG